MALDIQQKPQLACVGALHHTTTTQHIASSSSSFSVFNFDLNLYDHHHNKPAIVPITLDLFHIENNTDSSLIELHEPSPLPFGRQKCLNLKTGEIYYKKEKRRKVTTNMSRNGKNPRLDLKLNLSPPRGANNQHQGGQIRIVDNESSLNNRSAVSSPPSSCVSSEVNSNDETSPEATSMVLVGCPRCLMYVMLSEEDPKCPKCKSTVLLDFVHDHDNNNTTKNTKKRHN